jgi:hypothetical protein
LAPVSKFTLRSLVLFTTLPAAIVGALLWVLTGFLPGCEVVEHQRLPSPDGRFDLVVFSRSCGTPESPNTQAALIPLGVAVPEDAASFVSIGAAAQLQPQWAAPGAIAMTLPGTAEIYRSDATVAGITVTYR